MCLNHGLLYKMLTCNRPTLQVSTKKSKMELQYPYEAGEKALRLAKNWKTLSKQQLHNLLTSLNINAVFDSERDPDDMMPLDIPIDNYVVNFFEVYAGIRKITPEQALMIFYGYDETFPQRYGHIRPADEPEKRYRKQLRLVVVHSPELMTVPKIMRY